MYNYIIDKFQKFSSVRFIAYDLRKFKITLEGIVFHNLREK